MEVIYTNDTTWHVEIINGKERIPVKEITFGRTKDDADEVLKLDFPHYDAHLEAVVKEGIMQGHFVVRSKNNYRIPFAAYHGQKHRFITDANDSEAIDLGGKWKVTFEKDTDDEYMAIGEFKQVENNITGTFLTETGDYRFLEGVVQENKLWMSVFDGAHAFLFHAKMFDDKQLQGIFRSGKHYQSNWVAERDDKFTLKHPDSLSKAMLDEFSVSFPNEKGEMKTFPDQESDHVKILQVMGTWCPNCRDESEFLVRFKKEHPAIDLDITALAFERYQEQDKALATIARYKKQLDIPYQMLYAGPSSKSAASDILPMIDKVISYPTMIILDKKNKVRKVHTGFSGPATSKFEAFENEFLAFIKMLDAE